MYSAELQCNIQSMSYDFNDKKGLVVIDTGECCDMNGCIAMFFRMDRGVKEIMTISGSVDSPRDATYIRSRESEWTAVIPLKKEPR